jgi:hypothetical protein
VGKLIPLLSAVAFDLLVVTCVGMNPGNGG